MEGQALHVQHVWDVGAILPGHNPDLCFVRPLIFHHFHPAGRSSDSSNSRNSEIGPDGQCRIGLKLAANIPLLIFDIVINVRISLTSMLRVADSGIRSI
jgi:hypothetical protein